MNPLRLNTDMTLDRSESESITDWGHALLSRLGLISGHIALLAAWIAMCGSLFFSEVLGWQPCELCWYQRILMYPLAFVLPIGIVRRDRGLPVYVLPFSLTGIGVSLYHHLLITTDLLPLPTCVVDVPCTVDYLNWLGFITIPLLALTAFVIITTMMLVRLWAQFCPTNDADEIAAENAAEAVPSGFFDTANLAVDMIIVSVALAFLLFSTFV